METMSLGLAVFDERKMCAVYDSTSCLTALCLLGRETAALSRAPSWLKLFSMLVHTITDQTEK